MASDMEREIHEKLLLARVIMEGSVTKDGYYRLNLIEALEMLLTKKENDTALVQWIRNFAELGCWEETVLYIISRVTDLPSCPQAWRDNEELPLEQRMSHEDFKDWYLRTSMYIDRIINKYEFMYKDKIAYRKKQGSYPGNVEDGKRVILSRPVW